MTYEQFLEKLIDIDIIWDEPVLNEKDRYRTMNFSAKRGPAQIQCKWVVGGQDGGNCWNNRSYRLDAEDEPYFDALNTLLTKLCPRLFFIDYTELCDKLIEKDKVEEHEYYGNHTIYQTKTVKCKELFDYLT